MNPHFISDSLLIIGVFLQTQYYVMLIKGFKKYVRLLTLMVERTLFTYFLL